MTLTSRNNLADLLCAYDEREVAVWALGASDDEMLRVDGVSDWLLQHGPRTKSGQPMMYKQALAQAAVFVAEGTARPLRRRAQLPKAKVELVGGQRPANGDETVWPSSRDTRQYYGVDESFRNAWGMA